MLLIGMASIAELMICVCVHVRVYQIGKHQILTFSNNIYGL